MMCSFPQPRHEASLFGCAAGGDKYCVITRHRTDDLGPAGAVEIDSDPLRSTDRSFDDGQVCPGCLDVADKVTEPGLIAIIAGALRVRRSVFVTELGDTELLKVSTDTRLGRINAFPAQQDDGDGLPAHGLFPQDLEDRSLTFFPGFAFSWHDN